MKGFKITSVFRSAFLAAFVFALTPSAFAADAFFDETFGNYQEELETAVDDGKKGVFIFYHMEECPFCHRMRTTIMTEPDVIKLYKDNFMTIMHDIEGSNEITDFDGTTDTAQNIAEKKYRVRATPVMIIFDTKGQPVVKYTGPTRTKEEFNGWQNMYWTAATRKSRLRLIKELVKKQQDNRAVAFYEAL